MKKRRLEATLALAVSAVVLASCAPPAGTSCGGYCAPATVGEPAILDAAIADAKTVGKFPAVTLDTVPAVDGVRLGDSLVHVGAMLGEPGLQTTAGFSTRLEYPEKGLKLNIFGNGIGITAIYALKPVDGGLFGVNVGDDPGSVIAKWGVPDRKYQTGMWSYGNSNVVISAVFDPSFQHVQTLSIMAGQDCDA